MLIHHFIKNILAKHFGVIPRVDLPKMVRLAKVFEDKRGLSFRLNITNDGWVAECVDIPGIITGGSEVNPSKQLMKNQIADAIFSAFEIPEYLADPDFISQEGDESHNTNSRFGLVYA